ncbi:hypothetical protein G9P44_005630 [Scheffersomyces stipitis]|nr:hypothetical protein G9P44_005630 [Scheffersomyces stipitis]
MLAILFLFLLTAVSATKTFGVLVIRSGTQFQYDSLVSTNGIVYLSGGNGITFRLNDDGTLWNDATNNPISLDGDYNVIEGGNPTNWFSIVDDNLVYNGVNSFQACLVKDNTFRLSVNCVGGIQIFLRVVGVQDRNPTPPSPPPVNGRFGLISIHSGSQFQFNPINKVLTHPHVFSVGGADGSPVSLFLNADTTLTDSGGLGIYVDPTTGEFGLVDPFGQLKPTPGFSISEGYLNFSPNNNWKACPSGPNQFSLANNDCTGGTGIALKIAQ